MSMKTEKSLGRKLAQFPDLVDHFYNDTRAPHAKTRPGLTPIPMEHTSWIEEQKGWRNAATIFDQSHHMPELFLRGPDAMRLLKDVGVNSFENFVPNRAKQFVACNEDGYVIGECLIYCHSDVDFELVSGMACLNWVHYNALKGDYDVTVERDNQTSGNPTGKRTKFRFGMDGPKAADIFREVIEGDEVPDIKFFWTAPVRIAGCDVLALRHGMAGHQGVELSGAYEDGEKVRAAVLEVGERHGLRQGGVTTYFSTIAESGWMASPFPAIYSDPRLTDYLDWLPEETWEAGAQLGGSFVSDNIEDYYVTPWDLNLEGRIKFDHDFIGRAALERMAEDPKTCRRTLVWDDAEVLRVMGSMFDTSQLALKQIRMPYAAYAFQQNDAVRDDGGKLVGRATFCGYSANEGKLISMVMLDRDHAEIGTRLKLTWGEPDGGSRKPNVERHRQTDVDVTVAPAPFADVVRNDKHKRIFQK